MKYVGVRMRNFLFPRVYMLFLGDVTGVEHLLLCIELSYFHDWFHSDLI